MLQWINDRMKHIGWIIILPLGLVFSVWGVHGIVDFTTRQDKGLQGQRRGSRPRAPAPRLPGAGRAARRASTPTRSRRTVKKTTQDHVVEEFVNTALLDQKVKELRYVVSDKDVVESIARYQGFQVGGQFNKDAYYALLRAQGYTPDRFEAEQRQTLRVRALETALFVSSFATPAEIARYAALKCETREVAFAVLPLAKFLAAAKPDEAAVAGLLRRPTRTSSRRRTRCTCSYVALRVADAARDVVVDDAALKAYYETVKERYIEPEQRHARHILIQGNDAAAKKQADEVYALATKPGADFAALAKQYSKDAGSAGQGGDLGFAEKSFFVAPFADALFAMQPGEVKGPVKTQFGWHVIKLEAIQPGKAKGLDEVRGDLEREYRRAEAERRFGERQEKLEQLAFENNGSLEPVAKALGLKIEEVADFYKGLPGNELAANAKLLQAAFGADVLGGQNSRPIELSPGDVVVIRATDHRPPAEQPLEAVRARAVEGARRELAEREAKAAAGRVAAAARRRREVGCGLEAGRWRCRGRRRQGAARRRHPTRAGEVRRAHRPGRSRPRCSADALQGEGAGRGPGDHGLGPARERRRGGLRAHRRQARRGQGRGRGAPRARRGVGRGGVLGLPRCDARRSATVHYNPALFD